MGSCKRHGPFTLINSLFLKNIYFLSNIFFRKTSKCHSVTLRSDASKKGLLTSIFIKFCKRNYASDKNFQNSELSKKGLTQILNPESSYLGYFPKLWTNKGI